MIILKSELKKIIKEILKESKDFNQIKKGDHGEDYAGNKVIIIDKAKGKSQFSKISKYDESGAMKDGLSENGDSEMVAVKLKDGSHAVYVYGPDGVTIK